MMIFFFLTIWLTFFLLTKATETILNLSKIFQNSCLSLFSERPPLVGDLAEATLCGFSTSANPFEASYSQLGISHILVVSGAHLQFLLIILLKIPFLARHPKVLFGILTFYALISGCEPPVLRAWLELLLRQATIEFKLRLSPGLLVLASAFMTLPFALAQDKVFSLLLSWTASAVLCFSDLNSIKKLFIIQLLISFITEAWITDHAIFNLILNPLLGILILPFTIMMALTSPFDFAWELLLKIKLNYLNSLASIHFASSFNMQWPNLYSLKILIPILACCLAHCLDVQKKQRGGL